MSSFGRIGRTALEVILKEDILPRRWRSEDLFLSDDTSSGSSVIEQSEIVTYQSGIPLRFQHAVPTNLLPEPSRERDLRLKRLMDVTISLVAMLFLLPLFVLVGLTIKICSPGPIFFGQEREGLKGKPFKIFKLRTMDYKASDLTGVTQTVKDDPRIFAFGRFLRKTSIDELPQLINVFKGDMSLVGPRPHVSHMKAAGVVYRELVPYYDLRLAMRPGITGWAQANGFRGTTEDADLARMRVDHDVAYIANFSLALDIKTLAKTLKEEFLSGSGH